ncbi:hypothetical protein [uncultured Flavobacterium sp.]|uniref:hypothetical protein n=1 Tax=uncultured Flavobacterium sp. TaxID=165435 RepID=UPI0030CA1650
MKTKFNLPNFSTSQLEYQYNWFTGAITFYQNGSLVEKSKEKGTPLLLKNDLGTLVKVYQKKSFPDFSHLILTIDEKENLINKRLKGLDLFLAYIPVLLVFLGGMVGGALGGVASVINVNLLRKNYNKPLRYFWVFFVLFIVIAFYFLILKIFIK